MSRPFFRNIDAYYAQDDRRRFSGEVDFGVIWREGDEPWPNYRVSWIEATGDIYAVCFGGPNKRRIEHLGNVERRDAIEALLEGWAEIEPPTLDWVRERLRG